MKLILTLCLILSATYNFGQVRYVTKVNPCVFNPPEKTKGQNYAINVSLSIADSTNGFNLENFRFGQLEVLLVTNEMVITKNINPTIAGDQLSAKYSLDQETLDIETPLDNTDWKLIGYVLNYTTIAGGAKTSQYLYQNPAIKMEEYFTIQEFKKLVPDNISTYLIKCSNDNIVIKDVKIKSKESDNLLVAETNGAIINDGGVYKGTLKPSTSDISLEGDKFYVIEITYLKSGVQKSKKYSINLKPVQNFYVTSVENTEAYDNVNTDVTVGTSSIPKEIHLLFEDDNLLIKPQKQPGTNSIFSIPQADFGAMNFGVHNFRVIGTDLLGTNLSNASKVYTFHKKKPAPDSFEIITDKDNTITVKAQFPKNLSPETMVYLLITSQNGKKQQLSMSTEDKKTFTYKFNWADKSMGDLLTGADQKISCTVLIGNSKVPASTSILLPVQTISKDEIQKKFNEGGSDKKKTAKIADYLKEKNFQGDVDNVASSIVKELSAESGDRKWDNVWSQVVKLAPKVIGALVLLL